MKAKGGRASGAGGRTRTGGGMVRLTAWERAEWGEEVGKGWCSSGETPLQMPAYCLRSWSLTPGGVLERWPDSC